MSAIILALCWAALTSPEEAGTMWETVWAKEPGPRETGPESKSANSAWKSSAIMGSRGC